MLSRVIAYFDPARPGFLARMGRVARVGILGALALAAVGLFLLARRPETRYWWAVIQLEAGFPAAAARTARELVDDDPDGNYAPYRLMAAGQRRSGQVEAQLATFDEAARRFPDSWQAHGNRCWYGTLFGSAEGVMGSCDRAVELAPIRRGEAAGWRGVARAMTGDREGAIADLREAVRRFDARGERQRAYGALRREWLERLEAGDDPFDEAFLERERGRF